MNKQSDWKTEKKDGKTTSMIFSNKYLKIRKMKTQSKEEEIKPTTIGST